MKKPLATSGLELLDLSPRSHNCLTAAGIESIGELVLVTEDDLLRLPNFGNTSLREVRMKLSLLGLDLSPHVNNIPVVFQSMLYRLSVLEKNLCLKCATRHEEANH